MHTDLSRVLVEDQRARLSEAAQTPSSPILRRLWAMLLRGDERAEVVSLPAQDLDRLAA
jgi:hypothetical protein